MNDSTLIIIVAAIPSTLMALAAAITSMRNGQKVDATAQAITAVQANVAQVDAKADQTQIAVMNTTRAISKGNAKLDEVHDLTNRNFSEQKQEIAELRAQLSAAVSSAVIAELTRTTLARETMRALAQETIK
jgi:curli biogenesis system outer membrane secretion channel CsgG